MVATWLLELYMDQINRALLEEPPPPVTPQPGSSPEQAAAGHGAGANGDLSGCTLGSPSLQGISFCPLRATNLSRLSLMKLHPTSFPPSLFAVTDTHMAPHHTQALLNPALQAPALHRSSLQCVVWAYADAVSVDGCIFSQLGSGDW